MPRQLSPEKHASILRAAIHEIAEMGISAPTARIAKHAGIAEGTLFKYFASKDELLNTLYVELKSELGQKMAAGYEETESIEQRCRHVWNAYINWGAADPAKHKALRQLAVTERVNEESREAARKCMGHLGCALNEVAVTLKPVNLEFTAAIMGSLADTTLDFIAKDPARSKHYADMGFGAFWRAIGKG